MRLTLTILQTPMTEVVQSLQVISGLLWLLPALYLVPRIVRGVKGTATRTALLSMPICFVAWVQAGFSVRWLAWHHSLAGMDNSELTCWAALYALSGGCALWIFNGARQTRGE